MRQAQINKSEIVTADNLVAWQGRLALDQRDELQIGDRAAVGTYKGQYMTIVDATDRAGRLGICYGGPSVWCDYLPAKNVYKGDTGGYYTADGDVLEDSDELEYGVSDVG